MIVETKEGAICGGYSSKSWVDGSAFFRDNDAFVFNMS